VIDPLRRLALIIHFVLDDFRDKHLRIAVVMRDQLAPLVEATERPREGGIVWGRRRRDRGRSTINWTGAFY
jgi:hypothetical protein